METNSELIEDIEIRFKYHAPKLNQPERYKEMRELGLRLAMSIVRLTPSSRERSLALTKLDEVVMWANAAIARREQILKLSFNMSDKRFERFVDEVALMAVECIGEICQ